jgi:Uma2 family endonuclease
MPDFATEVLSPEDRPGRTARRITDYLQAGVRLVWIVDPEEGITVWERGAEPKLARPPEALTAAPILPGFSLDLAALFAQLHKD